MSSLLRSAWTVTFDGHTWQESDLTVAGASKAMGVCGGNWTEMHPLRSPDHFAGITAALLWQDGADFDESLARLAVLPQFEAVLMIGGPPDGSR